MGDTVATSIFFIQSVLVDLFNNLSTSWQFCRQLSVRTFHVSQSRFHQRIKPCQAIRLENQNSPLLISISGAKPVVWRQQQGPVWWAHRGHSVSHYPDDFLMAVWLDSARNDMPLSRSVWFCLLVSWLFSRHVQALWRYCETELAAKKWVIRLWRVSNQACHALLPTDDDSGIRV